MLVEKVSGELPDYILIYNCLAKKQLTFVKVIVYLLIFGDVDGEIC